MAQFARPDSDNSIGAWDDHLGSAVSIPSQLYSTIDETSASDSDYIFSENDPSASACSFTLSNVTDPTSSSDHVVRYRYRRLDTGGGSTPSIDLTVRLKQGATTIASQSHTGIATTYADGSFTLTSGEADNITDYTDLLIEFEADKSSGTRTSRAEVTWAEFEVPEPGGELRATQLFTNAVIGDNDPALRSTQKFFSALTDNDPLIRSTQKFFSALTDNDPALRSTQQRLFAVKTPTVWRYVPVSDISTGSWTTGATALWENLVLDDATYIDSSLNPTGGDAFEVSLRNFYWPETNYRLWIAMRISKVDSGGTQQEDGNQLDVLVEAINDSTTIWQWNLTDIKQDQGYLILEAPVSSPLATPITPTVFSLKATATSDGAGADRKARISYFNLFSYDSDPPGRCLWWPCNCGNLAGCDECASLGGLPASAAVTLSGFANNGAVTCCADNNTTYNVTLTADPIEQCTFSGSVAMSCGPTIKPTVYVSVDMRTGNIVVAIRNQGGFPIKEWFGQMLPQSGAKWDCTIDHTDFSNRFADPNVQADECDHNAVTLDGFVLS